MLVFTFLFSSAIVLIFRSTGQAQSKSVSTVYGTIIDAETGNPLSDVNVFLANTTIGAASAPDGSYQITNIPTGAFTLVFSRIGYQIKIIQLEFRVTQNFQCDIRLIQKPIKSKEITVIASVPKQWKRDLEKFTKLFVGESKNSKRTKILNPYILDFSTDQKTSEFFATSDSVLKIENRALGYQLHISLVRFKYDKRTGQCVYGMYARFYELKANSEQEQEIWQRNRLQTYQGSFRHFLSALARQELKREDFEIYSIRTLGLSHVGEKSMILPGAEQKSYENPSALDQEGEIHDLEEMISQTEFIYGTPVPIKGDAIIFSDSSRSIKKFKFENYLGVNYIKLNTKTLNNFLKLIDAFAEIDTFGNLLSPYAVEKIGDWANERVADSLPLDYKPND